MNEILIRGTITSPWMCRKTACKQLAGCEGSDGSMSIEYHGYDLVQDCASAWSRCAIWAILSLGMPELEKDCLRDIRDMPIIGLNFCVELLIQCWHYKAETGHFEWTTAEPVLHFNHNWHSACFVLSNLFEPMPFIPRSYIDRCVYWWLASTAVTYFMMFLLLSNRHILHVTHIVYIYIYSILLTACWENV